MVEMMGVEEVAGVVEVRMGTLGVRLERPPRMMGAVDAEGAAFLFFLSSVSFAGVGNSRDSILKMTAFVPKKFHFSCN